MVDVSFSLLFEYQIKKIIQSICHISAELHCLQTILADQSNLALEPDCKSKLEKRMEMFRNAEPVSELMELFILINTFSYLLINFS